MKSSELLPWERKGRVSPVVGTRPITTAAFSTAGTATSIVMPKATSSTKGSRARRATRSPAIVSAAKQPSTASTGSDASHQGSRSVVTGSSAPRSGAQGLPAVEAVHFEVAQVDSELAEGVAVAFLEVRHRVG